MNRWNKGSFLKTFLVALAVSLSLGVVLFTVTSSYLSRNYTRLQSGQGGRGSDISYNSTNNVLGTQQTAPIVTGNPVTAVAKTATSGVVGISALKAQGKSIFDNNKNAKWGVGSGVIVTSDGYILTNNHVAGGKNERIVVSLADGRNVDGTTVWADSVLDLAVVKVALTNLTTIPLGDAKTLQVGEPAIAIGNPLGLQFQRTVTSGIISALNRTIQVDTEQGSNYMEDLIQTDASINPGNSGGPLLNSKGQVVGINTIKVTSAEGMGFAIPINAAVPIIKQLSGGGKFTEAYMGVFAYDKNVASTISNSINNSLRINKGVYVSNSDEAGPAFKSGIKVGCTITRIDNTDINTMMDLRTYIHSKRPGDTVNVTCVSNGKTSVVPVKLEAKTRDGLVTR